MCIRDSYSTLNNNGCDSTATLNLTINNSTTGTDVQTACDTYTWIDGVTYTSSNNTATHTLTNAAGCDSVVTLDLTINNSTTSTTAITACDSYDWNGTTYTSSGSYDYVTTNAAGCDSTATLNLTIAPAPSVNITPAGPITICDGLSTTLYSSVTNANYSYEWNDASGAISGATSTTYLSLIHI